jgi:hypothetical protein
MNNDIALHSVYKKFDAVARRSPASSCYSDNKNLLLQDNFHISNQQDQKNETSFYISSCPGNGLLFMLCTTTR